MGLSHYGLTYFELAYFDMTNSNLTYLTNVDFMSTKVDQLQTIPTWRSSFGDPSRVDIWLIVQNGFID